MAMPDRLLVLIFQRGGADGLAVMPPVHDDLLQRLRPSLAQRPGQGLRLDDLFELHPRMGALSENWHQGQLAVIPGCGSDDQTRSHFEAQDLMEHGAASIGSGWLGRFLRENLAHPLQAVAMGDMVPLMLASAPGAMAYRCLQDSHPDPAWVAGLATLYAQDRELQGQAATALQAGARLSRWDRAGDHPEHGARYGADDTAQSLRALAALYKQGALELRVACLDCFGWDTHVAQDSVLGSSLEALAQALAAFARDLGPLLERVSIVVLSEFGRRVSENATFGTDHGRGGVMLVLGGGVRGGVHGSYPGLSPQQLVDTRDLAVTTDYRQVLSAVLARHGVVGAQTFPGWDGRPLAL